MSYSPLIIKSEFRSQVKLGANVGTSDELDSYIQKFQEKKFKPIVSSDFYTALLALPDTNKPELQTFLDEYIKPFLINGTYETFLLWHGRNISQYGLIQNREDTSDAISDKARAELMTDIRNDMNVCMAEMMRKLKESNYTFDSVIYNFSGDCNIVKAKPRLGFWQAGRSRSGY